MDELDAHTLAKLNGHDSTSEVSPQTIYCGDNLDKLRSMPDGFVDLVYIDPPFNSNRDYEVFWGETKEKRAFEDRHESTKAYIEFMRPRCVELARVLKKTGSFYYHCDWHASHYVKVLLDQVFGENNFQNEIVWKRTNSHNDSKRFAHIHDIIYFYSKSQRYTWNPQHVAHSENYIRSHYGRKDKSGRQYRLDNIIRSASMGPRPNLVYEYNGFTPEWGWRVERKKLEVIDADGRLAWTSSGTPYLVRYLDEMKGTTMPSIWDDIPPVNSQAAERLGYPTQKPLPLLERIITASSNPQDIVLDAFCGCGTALVAAERLDRRWIGIDVSPTACRVMAKRLEDECRIRERKDFFVRDMPHSEHFLRKIPPFEFENWAVVALGGIPNSSKVGDMGIDGRIYPVSAMPVKSKDRLNFMEHWYPIQVKQKDKAGRQEIDQFETAMRREGKVKGFFVSFDYTLDAEIEMWRFLKEEGREIVPIRVNQILEGRVPLHLSR